MTTLAAVARHTRTMLAVLAVGLALAACALGRSTPEIRYYVLAVPGDEPAAVLAPVHMGDLTIDDPYATRQLAYRASPYRLAYYNYHRWAGSPERLVAAAAREYMERGAAADDAPPFEVTGRIRRLEEIDERDQWIAALAVEFTVRRQGIVVLERTYNETTPAAHRNPEAVVAALSRGLGRVLEALARELAALDAPAPVPASR